MFATDFEYDGLWLSDFGFIICTFDPSNGTTVVDSGSKITFNNTGINSGRKFISTGSKYDECIQATFDICKDPDRNEDLYITNDEYRRIIRWLNRREFLNLRFIDDEHPNETCYYMASFNVQEIKVRELLYGIRLTMQTNAPFGFGEEIKNEYSITNTSKSYVFYNLSDEIGVSYPSIEIICNEAGNMTITSSFDGSIISNTTINNCSQNEVIKINGETQMIESSDKNHNIANDFNYGFFKVENSYINRENLINVSLPCNLIVRYKPIVKDLI